MIEYLEYRKNKLPIRIKMFALQKYEEEMGESWDEAQARIQDKPPSITEVMKMYEPILFYGLKAGARAVNRVKVMVPWFDDDGREIEVELSRDSKEILEDMLDECMEQLTGLFKKFFPEQEAVDLEKKPMPSRAQRREKARQDKK